MSEYPLDARSPKRIDYLVSTDLVGVSAKDIKKLLVAYAQVEAEIQQDSPNFQFKYEVIAWLATIQSMLKSIEDEKRLAGGIHSRIGLAGQESPLLSGHLLHAAFNTMLMPVDKSINLAIARETKYVVVHDNEVLGSKRSLKAVESYLSSELGQKESSPVIMIENSPFSHSWEKTWNAVKRLEEHHGQRVGFMVDVLHLCKDLTHNVYSLSEQELDILLNRILMILHLILSSFDIVGLHLPMGNNYDSMPTKKIRPNFWNKARQVLDCQPSLRYFTIENQHFSTQLGMQEADLPLIARRNSMEFIPLIQAGLFTLNS